jgi:hypothetical protein
LQKLTCSLSFDLLGRNGEDREYLGHDLNKNLGHFGSQRNPSINPKAPEDVLGALKQLNERVVTCSHIFSRLYNVSVKRGPRIAASKDTDRKEYSYPSEDGACGGKRLQGNIGIHFK